MKQRHRIYAALFSFYFLIYAVSPLSLSLDVRKAIAQANISIKGIRLFVFDLLLQSPSTEERNTDGFDEAGVVLFKKKRATLSSGKAKLLNPQKEPGMVAAFVFSPEDRGLESLSLIEEYHHDRSFVHSYSGLSPPAVKTV